MLQSVKDHLSRVWQGRFRWGMSGSLGSWTFNRYANGAFVVGVYGPSFISSGTGHWPWFMFEVAVAIGPAPSWHLGLLGFTGGMLMSHTVDTETNEIVGPDRARYYWFFKGHNHQQKDLEEIIGCQ